MTPFGPKLSLKKPKQRLVLTNLLKVKTVVDNADFCISDCFFNQNCSLIPSGAVLRLMAMTSELDKM